MKRLLAILISLHLLAGLAAASYISLNTSLATRVTGKKLEVLVSSVNKGDEAAYNVQAEFRLGKEKSYAKKMSQLGVNRAYQDRKTYAIDVERPGRYPLIMALHYTDANQYPFSALTAKVFAYQAADLPSEIYGRLSSTTFWQTGQAKLTLKNAADTEIKAAAHLETPREITLTGPKQEIVLPPRSERSLVFDLANFSALSGSNYQIFAVTEYDKDGFHQTTITPGMIRIQERRGFLGLDYVYWVALLVVLTMIFLAYQFVWPRWKK